MLRSENHQIWESWLLSSRTEKNSQVNREYIQRKSIKSTPEKGSARIKQPSFIPRDLDPSGSGNWKWEKRSIPNNHQAKRARESREKKKKEKEKNTSENTRGTAHSCTSSQVDRNSRSNNRGLFCHLSQIQLFLLSSFYVAKKKKKKKTSTR